MGLGCAPPTDVVLLEMGYPGGFGLEKRFAIWTSFKETGVGLKVL